MLNHWDDFNMTLKADVMHYNYLPDVSSVGSAQQ
jgi:hypothetical protein